MRRENADIIVKAAAVGDFRPVDFSVHKMKKEDVPMIQLTKNPDILQEVCAKKTHGVVIGFCMETRDLVRQAYETVSYTHLDVYKRQRIDIAAGTDTRVG